MQSYNVIGELRGRDLPNEVVVLGGHFDSWDPGVGATDDGGGCIVTWEALRLMKTLNLRPRRTVRVVLFVNEENGLRGGNAYRDAHAAELGNHVLMLESDGGVFDPSGFGFSGSRRGARGRDDDRGPAGAARRRSHRPRPAAAPTSARPPRPARSRRCRTRSTASTS